MDELARLLTLLALAGSALTLAGGVVIWLLNEQRRVRLSLKKVLKAPPDPVLTARGRGQGIGFDLGTATVGITWDAGAWCLTYPLAALMGAELIVDDQVAARVHRGEARRPLDRLSGATAYVTLRFVFDDVNYPDFPLELWRDEDEGRRGRLTEAQAMQEGSRWLARIESILRRPSAQRTATAPAMVAKAEPPPPDPAWEADDDEDEEALSA
jgi:hypothetical protein